MDKDDAMIVVSRLLQNKLDFHYFIFIVEFLDSVTRARYIFLNKKRIDRMASYF